MARWAERNDVVESVCIPGIVERTDGSDVMYVGISPDFGCRDPTDPTAILVPDARSTPDSRPPMCVHGIRICPHMMVRACDIFREPIAIAVQIAEHTTLAPVEKGLQYESIGPTGGTLGGNTLDRLHRIVWKKTATFGNTGWAIDAVFVRWVVLELLATFGAGAGFESVVPVPVVGSRIRVTVHTVLET